MPADERETRTTSPAAVERVVTLIPDEEVHMKVPQSVTVPVRLPMVFSRRLLKISSIAFRGIEWKQRLERAAHQIVRLRC